MNKQSKDLRADIDKNQIIRNSDNKISKLEDDDDNMYSTRKDQASI